MTLNRAAITWTLALLLGARSAGAAAGPCGFAPAPAGTREADRVAGDGLHVPETAARTPRDRARTDPADRVHGDFTLAALPTTLRLPKFKSGFRVTHRFTRSLGQGDFGSLLEDLFGFDSSAFVGLEYRFGLTAGTQVGIHRTSGRTIQFFGQHAVLDEGEGHALGLQAVLAIEGTNNFREQYSPAAGLVLSRTLGSRAALYAQPIWVGNANLLPGGGDDTLLAGFGARIRLTRTAYAVGEIAPRIGHAPGAMHVSLGLEKRAGGHFFQVNLSNSPGTTFGQIARGGASYEDWFVGFNISRRFF